MATLAVRITALAEAVRNKINAMMPRLLPAGGAEGQALIKASGADFAASWAKVNRAFGVTAFCSGKPADAEIIGAGIAPYAFAITEANCAARALNSATSSAVFTIRRNGSEVGTVTFSVGQLEGTVAISDPAIAVGDLVTIAAPTSADSTLADISFLLLE